jgi:hypothetical protein
MPHTPYVNTLFNIIPSHLYLGLQNVLFPSAKQSEVHAFRKSPVYIMCRATNRKVVGSIPDGVTGIFH